MVARDLHFSHSNPIKFSDTERGCVEPAAKTIVSNQTRSKLVKIFTKVIFIWHLINTSSHPNKQYQSKVRCIQLSLLVSSLGQTELWQKKLIHSLSMMGVKMWYSNILEEERRISHQIIFGYLKPMNIFDVKI